MRKKYILVANWKMYLDFDRSIKYSTDNIDKLSAFSESYNSNIVLCPSYPLLYPMINMFKSSKIEFGAQDCSAHSSGAFTGQVCAQTLRHIGCRYCIIGHSERRRFDNETDELIARKFDVLAENNISPIICVGESINEKKSGKIFDILEQQTQKIFELASVERNKLNNLPVFIAYEPEWSVGTGDVPDKNYLESVLAWLQNKIQKNSLSTHWSLLYGGSVNSGNIEFLKRIGYLSGFLIGRASTNFQEFEKIIKTIYYL